MKKPRVDYPWASRINVGCVRRELLRFRNFDDVTGG